MMNRESMIIDALDFFQAWLCGKGLTSPGLMLDTEALRAQLERIDRVKSKALVALRPDFHRRFAPESRQGGCCPENPLDDLSERLLLLDDDDCRLMRAAIELYLEEADCVAAFVSPSQGMDDLRELLARVSAHCRGKRTEPPKPPEASCSEGSIREIP